MSYSQRKMFNTSSDSQFQGPLNSSSILFELLALCATVLGTLKYFWCSLFELFTRCLFAHNRAFGVRPVSSVQLVRTTGQQIPTVQIDIVMIIFIFSPQYDTENVFLNVRKSFYTFKMMSKKLYSGDIHPDFVKVRHS